MSDLEMTRPQAMATARRMAEGEWQVKQIQAYLGSRGHAVSWDTVKGWSDPEWAERRRKAKRDSKRAWWREHHGSGGFRVLDADARRRLAERLATPLPTATPAMSVDLMLALRVDDGLSYVAIAKVADRIYGQKLSAWQVRDRLNQQGVPKNPAKVRSAQKLNTAKAAA